MRMAGFLVCGYLFIDGRLWLGSLLLLVELSVLLIPMAMLMSRHMNERTNVDRILMELSMAQRGAAETYAVPVKQFYRA